MSKFCAYCGTALKEEALFCQSCGARQPVMTASPAPVTEQNPTSIGSGTYPATPASQAPQTGTVVKKKPVKALLICGIAVVAAIVVILFLTVGGSKREAPFFGLERGDSVEDVEKAMGDPDDFQDNYMNNYNYYYEDIEFLDMTGYLDVHFKMDKVNTLKYVSSYASKGDYNDAVDYYTKKYGEPEYEYTDTSGSSGDYTYWDMDGGTRLVVEYYSASKFSPSHVYIRIYS